MCIETFRNTFDVAVDCSNPTELVEIALPPRVQANKVRLLLANMKGEVNHLDSLELFAIAVISSGLRPPAAGSEGCSKSCRICCKGASSCCASVLDVDTAEKVRSTIITRLNVAEQLIDSTKVFAFIDESSCRNPSFTRVALLQLRLSMHAVGVSFAVRSSQFAIR